MRGQYLVMRFGPRAGWHMQIASVAGRHQSLVAALDWARYIRRRYGARVWIAAAGAPASLPRAARGKP